MMMMSFPIGSETESSPAACKKIERVFTPLLLFDLKRKLSAFFLPDEFSQKDLFVRVERLLFGKREREREKVASARQSKTKKRSSSSSKIDLIKKVPRTTNVRLCKKRGLTLMISDNSWLISAWNANVSVSASSPMIDDDDDGIVMNE